MKYILIYLLLLLILSTNNLSAQVRASDIQLNQEGFYPNAPKLAVLTKRVNNGFFYIIKTNLKDTVFKGGLSGEIFSNNSSLITRLADFSKFTEPGTYIIAIPGSHNSYPFQIAANVNREAAIAVLKGFYFQRVSMPLQPAFAGKWARAAGHPDTAVLIHPSAASKERPAGTVILSPGGWYDAGDYNKYIVNSGITMGTLLSAYEDFSAYFSQLKTNIPESRNKVPDILDEIIYNLRWMQTMQDPADGGVYNKCTNADFDGMVMPGVTKAPRYLVQKGTAATLDFAAVMAQSSRVFQKFERELPGLADSCLKAAISAWQWAQKNPAFRYDQDANNKIFLPRISTGGYGDGKYEDEVFWAACELFVTTKGPQFFEALKKGIANPVTIPSWGNVQMLGVYTLLRSKEVLPIETQPVIEEVQHRFLQFARALSDGIDRSAFRTVMGKSRRDFNWGSNSNAANQGIALVNAYKLTKDTSFMHHALGNLDYILGRNATGYCFVTGIGTRFPMHPHHRPSVADGIEEPVPGLLAGGPNPAMQDKCVYEFTEPETAFTDVDCSYASNEIAINWNAPLVYLSNAIEALQYETAYSK